MFDIGWQELFVLGVIALIVVGPKELPGLLRTIGRYVGIVKRQAGEFRAQFDQALREAELDQLKKDVTDLRGSVEGTLRDTVRAAERQLDTSGAPKSSRAAAVDELFDDPDAHDENGLPVPPRAKPPSADGQAEAPGGEAQAPSASGGLGDGDRDERGSANGAGHADAGESGRSEGARPQPSDDPARHEARKTGAAQP